MRSKRFVWALILTVVATLSVAAQEPPASNTYDQRQDPQAQSAPPSSGRHVEVVVLNNSNGKPIAGVWVTLRSGGQSGAVSWPKSARTNQQGAAAFTLADPTPERVSLSFDVHAFAACSSAGFATERILSSGAIAGSYCTPGKVISSRPPAAGQILVYGRAVNLWDRINEAIPFLTLFS